MDLAEEEGVFRAALEAVDRPIWIATPGFAEVAYVNPALAALWGLEQRELEGSPDRLLEAIHPSDRHRVERARQELPDGTYEETYRVRRPDGNIRWVRETVSALAVDGNRRLVGTVEDVTDRRARTEEIERHHALMETVTDGIVTVDRHGRIVSANRAMGEIFGYDPAALEGESLDTLIPGITPVAQQLAVGQPEGDAPERTHSEVKGTHADGSSVPLEVSFLEVEIDGVRRYLGSIREVTRRRAYERELERRALEQEAVARLGQRALETDDLDSLMDEAAHVVADVLDNAYCKVLDLDPERRELLLRQGVGWDEGIVGQATVAADENSQAGYTLLSEEPVVVTDLTTETRFSGPDLLVDHGVISGISTIIGSIERPWGILGTHDTRYREFSREDVNFVQSVANVLAAAIEQHQTRSELERTLDLFERTEQIADVGGWEVEQDRGIFWTGHLFDMLGYPGEEEPPLEEALSFYHEEDRPRVQAAIEQAFASGEPFDIEARIRTASGEIRWLRLQGVPEPQVAGAKVIRGAAQDITERIDRERRLEQLVERLEASNERLEQFAYAASHDLQEPLRMVSSYLMLIEQRYGDLLDEDGREFLEYATDGAERMRHMIDGLLQYSRVETGGEPLEPVDLDAILAAVQEDLSVTVAESGAEITSDPLPVVLGDAAQLRQVFQNLLTNAIEYAGDAAPSVHITATWNEDEWVIAVADRGIGIAPSDQEQIFDVFQGIPGDGNQQGTGIGLALCRRIIERHGGDIWVDSTPGEGATFCFSLPAAPENAG